MLYVVFGTGDSWNRHYRRERKILRNYSKAGASPCPTTVDGKLCGIWKREQKKSSLCAEGGFSCLKSNECWRQKNNPSVCFAASSLYTREPFIFSGFIPEKRAIRESPLPTVTEDFAKLQQGWGKPTALRPMTEDCIQNESWSALRSPTHEILRLFENLTSGRPEVVPYNMRIFGKFQTEIIPW